MAGTDFLGIAASDWQSISSIALTAMSTVVACVAAVFSFRQNVGWAPISFVENEKLGGVANTECYKLSLKLAVWNRRKYPIVLQKIEVRPIGVLVVLDLPKRQSEFSWVEVYGWLTLGETLLPAQRLIKECAIVFDRKEIHRLKAQCIITVCYFDPIKNRTYNLSYLHKPLPFYFGWAGAKVDSSTSKMEENLVRWAEEERVGTYVLPVI